MSLDLERINKLTINEPWLVKRHALMALSISLVHTVICLFYFVGDYFNSSLTLFVALFSAIWLGNFGLGMLAFSGVTLTQQWREPAMSGLWTLWLTSGFLVSSYYVDVFRISVLMLFFSALLLASFRCGFWKVAALSVFACTGYAVVLILAFSDHGMALSLSVEGLQWLIFSLSCIGFTVTGTGINHLRNNLANTNEQLHEAYAKAREMSIRDGLTGLYNRRHIMEVLGSLKGAAEKQGNYGFCICYLDLDHFKPINDTYGHGVGDEVLRRFANLLQDALRGSDYTARLGGEEFILVLNGAELDRAEQVCDRLRERLENTSFKDLHPGLKVTVSIGVAAFQPGESIDQTLTRADHCLYRAKTEGRNRVVTERVMKAAEPVPPRAAGA